MVEVCESVVRLQLCVYVCVCVFYRVTSSNLAFASCCPKAPFIKGTSQSLKNSNNEERRDERACYV